MILWQDIILTGGSIVFLLALFPTLLSKDKPAIATSVMTGGVLLVYAVVYASLSLWFSVIATAATGLLWFILAVQKVKQKKSHSKK